ncbi:hypothetical protein HHK36_008798 [Tetracentron sinense]|uniref:Pentatricopeptide repeat-containing protein n=1 Tax=Tetracentron sinense TaxID=13715 RepID=A0A834ZGZ8_TETSI|nr:hypothetical protein HHK36_008798 [Tetracentron sinense]
MGQRQTQNLAKALIKNANNPSLSWLLFNRILSSPSSSVYCFQSIPAISRILVRAKMLPEIDQLHQLLLLQPLETSHLSLIALVKILAKSGLLDKALSQFQSLRSQFPKKPPPVSLYNLLLQSSLRENRLEFISVLYKDMLVAGISPETYTLNLLISSLCDSGRLEDAKKIFDKMPEKGCQPNEFSFGILVRGYCRAGIGLRALELLNEMRTFGCSPNRVIYNTLISSFCRDGRVDEAERLVEKMREDGLFPDVVTFNSRISALCSAGNILEASRIFRDMQKDDKLGLPRPNHITFNLMLEGFFKGRMLDEAEVLVESMKRNGYFTKLESYNIWLMGLVRNGKLVEARIVFKEMVDKGISPNIYSYNIVIDGLCKDGMLSDARMVMDVMINNGISPDTVTYSTLLHAYCRKRKVFDAGNILHEMIRNGCFPNTITCNILLQSLWKEGRISEAEKLLQKMNKRGYGLDTVTCNIVIDGLCKSEKLDKAIEIVSGMWDHGSAALGDLGNSFIGLVDNTNNGKKCVPDLITYSIIIDGLCKAGRLDEAKKKLVEMMSKNLDPDSIIYDTFIRGFCKHGKLSSAFRVLREMEKKGCNKSTKTYNSLILGLRNANQIDEMFGLMNEMKERGISPNVFTYNNLISSLCEIGRTKDATSLLDEMLQRSIFPNVSSFRSLISAFCKACDFGAAQEVFEIGLSICGHKEALYSLMFNELLVGGKVSEAKELFEVAVDRCCDVGDFLYKELIEGLCKEENLEGAQAILRKMIDKGYGFNPASFMPVIDCLGKRGNKHEADELAERMMEMASEGRVVNKAYRNEREINCGKPKKDAGSERDTALRIFNSEIIILKILKFIESTWKLGQNSDE